MAKSSNRITHQVGRADHKTIVWVLQITLQYPTLVLSNLSQIEHSQIIKRRPIENRFEASDLAGIWAVMHVSASTRICKITG